MIREELNGNNCSLSKIANSYAISKQTLSYNYQKLTSHPNNRTILEESIRAEQEVRITLSFLFRI